MSTDAAAFAEFPELRRLVDLRDGGWLFVPRRVDGELDRLNAVRTWPDGTAEAVMVKYVTDAAAHASIPTAAWSGCAKAPWLTSPVPY